MQNSGINWKKQTVQGVKDVLTRPIQSARAVFIGAGVGVIPGLGGSVAAFLAYLVAMRRSKYPETFGKGNLEGVLATEISNDAKDGGSLLPTVAFGIPGGGDMAILLGAFVLHGLQPGPLLLRDHMDIVYVLLFGIVISQVAVSGGGLFIAPLLARVSVIPSRWYAPFVLILVALGAYMLKGNIWDTAIAMLIGIFGYTMRRYGFSLITIAIGFILGPMAEKAYLQSMMISHGSHIIFIKRPISIVLMLLTIITLVMPLIIELRNRRKELS